MNIKNNKGITVTVLVITIIIMLILFAITYTSAIDLLRNSQKNKMKTMLYMVQSRGEILLNDYMFKFDGTDLSTVSNEDIEKALKGRYITDPEELLGIGFEADLVELPGKNERIYCVWNENVLKSQGIDTDNLAMNDTIIMQYNIETSEVGVATKKGFFDGSKSIHTLKDFLK